jgi:pyridoxamine 5'-phosphate oxidase
MNIDSHRPGVVPDFSRPLEALKASHERIRSQCDALRDLVSHMKEHGCDGYARETTGKVIRKLDTVTYHHKEDEEQDLLPRMVAAATMGRGSSLTRMVADIASEHRTIDRTWTELRAALQAVAAGDRAELDALLVDRFIKLYCAHIAIERVSVYPLAEMLLSREDLEVIGARMAQRRRVRHPS